MSSAAPLPCCFSMSSHCKICYLLFWFQAICNIPSRLPFSLYFPYFRRKPDTEAHRVAMCGSLLLIADLAQECNQREKEMIRIPEFCTQPVFSKYLHFFLFHVNDKFFGRKYRRQVMHLVRRPNARIITITIVMTSGKIFCGGKEESKSRYYWSA